MICYICLVLVILIYFVYPVIDTLVSKTELKYSFKIWRFLNRFIMDKYVDKKTWVHGFTLFCGSQGGGKTYCAVDYCVKLAKKYGGLLVSNTPLNMDKDVNYYFLKHVNEIRYLPDYPCYIILLDEIQTLFDSMHMDNAFYTIFCQLRKRNIKIVGTAQVFERVAVKLREQVDDLYICRTYFGCLTRKKKYLPDLTNAGKLRSDLLKLDTEYLIQTDYIRNMYDTYFRI